METKTVEWIKPSFNYVTRPTENRIFVRIRSMQIAISEKAYEFMKNPDFLIMGNSENRIYLKPSVEGLKISKTAESKMYAVTTQGLITFLRKRKINFSQYNRKEYELRYDPHFDAYFFDMNKPL